VTVAIKSFFFESGISGAEVLFAKKQAIEFLFEIFSQFAI